MWLESVAEHKSGFHSDKVSPLPAETESRRSVFVIFTSGFRTLKALEEAGRLAGQIGGHIVIVAAQVVPYILPLNEPPVSMQFILERFSEIIARSHVDASIAVYACRNRLEALKKILTPGTPVLIGVNRGWWPAGDIRLARNLRRAGYAVLTVETE